MESKFTILLMDDMQSNLLSTEALILEYFDVNIIKAYNGEEGLKVIFKNHIDLILSDVQMPVMDGFEFARLLSQNSKFSTIPFIFITAMHVSDQFVKEGMDLGAVDYIKKPINANIFVAKLKVFINLYDAKANLHSVNEKLKKQMQKTQEQELHLIQQSRLAQMGEMISMIAHQWRQPLASISSIANTLLIDAEIDTLDKAFLINRLNSVSDLASHLSKTVDDFRDFFKPDKNKQDFFVSEALEETLHVLEPLLLNIEVFKSIKNEEKIVSYKNELMHVLLNIINNSIDAIKESKTEYGKITIDILCKQDGYIKINIGDNAGGIPTDIIQDIFNPYFSTKSKNGTGLGLYMSKIIIENHCQGDIMAFNKMHGAMFEINLPIKINNKIEKK